MSINTQDSAEVVCTELLRAVFHSNIPKHHTDTARAPAPAALPTTLMSLRVMSAIIHSVRDLSPLPLPHLMCAFSGLLTCDTTDLNPMTEPSYSSPTCTEPLSLYWQYILQRDDIWILEQLRWVTAVAWTSTESTWSHSQAALDLLLHAGRHHSHATEFPYQNNIKKGCIWNK